MMIDISWKTDTCICFLPYIPKIYCFQPIYTIPDEEIARFTIDPI
jgi:hypothetical protein